ncbi:uncharacterized protein TNCV_4325651 [Trichonephila clavipes]|nr:uncharacterized protein TNCV_4325651 [Trichonephila clavipes]
MQWDWSQWLFTDVSQFSLECDMRREKDTQKPMLVRERSQYKRMPLWHGGTLNSCRAASLLVRFVGGEQMWEAPDHPQGFLPLNSCGTEQNRTATCMVLKAKTNDWCKNSSP